ncbi:PAS domain-containing sensor histidine kinase [Campylobacter pinnipediorum]|uniref:histidine kinase n=1 Tax=Campylobacter pinnipediorum subsp. pinnipediorum TaxID=1660067 RepID=A0AAX0LCM6_9BACT|nr:PAS domain-containing sensor histidine kinase [Campylobacter pinnipediorum]AQW82314.1 PAS sensor-containing two-component system histidine kinase [Campylobacter pinnipediorum subsp. pinnipediorum]OPA82027.1 PAS domain-containing sensor histidine kinase [Campylobacter pinnipediorum subsp. pinnipediorum]
MDDIKDKFEQYQYAIEASNIVSKTDINGIITFVNDEFCQMSGYTKQELIGKNHNTVRHPDVSQDVFKNLWDTILSKKVYKGIIKNLTKDKRTIYLHTTISPILNSKGDIEEFVAIRYDTTKLIELNEQLISQEQELKKLNESLETIVQEKTMELRGLNENLQDIIKSEVAKNEEQTKIILTQSRLASMGEMIANIAHQWRQPLNELSITLFKMSKDKNKFNESYEKCKNIIKNMSNTIEDFRNFFSTSKAPEAFLISDALHDSIMMLQGTFEKKHINVSINTDFDTEVFGYKSKLTQVILNILNNAKDACIERDIKNKQIKIITSQEQDLAVISICDNAGGISDEIIDKIFEPYFTTKHSSQGTGIGLYMSKLIIDKLKGVIIIKNKDNGACFSIKIPIKGELSE